MLGVEEAGGRRGVALSRVGVVGGKVGRGGAAKCRSGSEGEVQRRRQPAKSMLLWCGSAQRGVQKRAGRRPPVGGSAELPGRRAVQARRR